MDSNQLIRNCNQRSLEELRPYFEQWVALSEDGREILASAADLEKLFQEIDRRELAGYVLDYIPAPEEDFLGGGTI